MNNIHPELIEEFATTADEERAIEILKAIVAYFMAIYDAERELFLEDNKLDLPFDENEADSVRLDFMLYITDLLTSIRTRTLRKIEEQQDSHDRVERATMTAYIMNLYQRIKETESVNAQQIAQIEVVKKVQQTMPGAKIYKVWISKNDADTCEICRALHGTVLPINQPFLVNGQIVSLDSGDEFIYEYIDRQVAIAHPNDRCRIDFFIEY